jgi:hypothetical protein
MLTILNALPRGCTKLSVGSTQVGFVMALAGVPVKELLNSVGYWLRTRVPCACQRAASVKNVIAQKYMHNVSAGIFPKLQKTKKPSL